MPKLTFLVLVSFLFNQSAYAVYCESFSAPCIEFNNPKSLSADEIYAVTIGALNPGIPIILIHGAGHNLKYFRSLAIQLSLKHKVVLIDLRGHGRTKAVGTNYSAEVLSRDVYQKLLALNINKAHFIGHSFGAKVVAQFAANYPQLTEKIVFIDMEFIARQVLVTSDLEKMLSAGVLFEKQIALTYSTYEEAQKALIPYYGTMTTYKLQNDAYFDNQGIHLLFHPAVDFYFFGYQMNLEDQTSVLEKIQSEVLLVAGSVNSAISPKGLEHAKKHIKNLQYNKIEGAGHAPHMTNLEDFLKIINVFLPSEKVTLDYFSKLNLTSTEEDYYFLSNRIHIDQVPVEYWRGVLNVGFLYRFAEENFQTFLNSEPQNSLYRPWVEYYMAKNEFSFWNIDNAKARLAQIDTSKDEGLTSNVIELLSWIESIAKAKPTITQRVREQRGETYLEFYSKDQAYHNANRILDDLSSTNSELREALSDLTVIVTPENQGVQSIEGFENPIYSGIEGTSYIEPQFLNNFITKKHVIIRHDSVSRWSEGLVHEILHIYSRNNRTLIEKMRNFRARNFGFLMQDTSEHLFVYVAQYYVVGYKTEVKNALKKILGEQEGNAFFTILEETLKETNCFSPLRLGEAQIEGAIWRTISNYYGILM